MADQVKVRECIMQAREHIEAGERDKALELIRKALALDPDEQVITETILFIEEDRSAVAQRPSPTTSKPARLPERTDPMAIDPKLEKALDLSEKCRKSGDNAKALAYLKKAIKLFPGNALVEEKLTTLTTVLKAENLVAMARTRIERGEPAGAVTSARLAFQLLPDVPGLVELLDDLEAMSQGEPESGEFNDDLPDDFDLEEEDILEDYEDSSDTVEDLIERIRQLVREDRWDDAAILVEQGVMDFSGNELLETFKVKFKRLGFLS